MMGPQQQRLQRYLQGADVGSVHEAAQAWHTASMLLSKAADVRSKETAEQAKSRTALTMKGADVDSRERIADQQQQTKMAELDSREAIALLQAEVQSIKARLDAQKAAQPKNEAA